MSLKAIIPAAGYGVRMGMHVNESKEMLQDPNDSNKRIIDYSLDLCYKYGIEPVVISRIEKNDLNSYLNIKGVEHIILKKPGKEWAETVLKSSGLWGEKNILILPDTRFDEDIIPKLLNDLAWNHNSDVVAAVHEIDPKDSEKWGVIYNNHIYEKCPNITASNLAWGLLAWNGKSAALDIFYELTPGFKYTQWNDIPYIKMNKFLDVTRTGKLEKY